SRSPSSLRCSSTHAAAASAAELSGELAPSSSGSAEEHPLTRSAPVARAATTFRRRFIWGSFPLHQRDGSDEETNPLFSTTALAFGTRRHRRSGSHGRDRAYGCGSAPDLDRLSP